MSDKKINDAQKFMKSLKEVEKFICCFKQGTKRVRLISALREWKK